MISSQDNGSGHGHLHPDMPQTPSHPGLLLVCQTGQGSLFEHSGVASIEFLMGRNEVHFDREKTKGKGLKHEIIRAQ